MIELYSSFISGLFSKEKRKVKGKKKRLGAGGELTMGMAQQRACWPMAAQIEVKSLKLVGVEGAE